MTANTQFSSARAFTLVEVMIVCSLIGLLATLGVPSYMRARQSSLALKCIEHQRMIHAAVVRYEMDHNRSLQPIRNDGVALRNTLLAAGFISIKQAFECPVSQMPDNDDIHLQYNNQEFVGPICTIAPTQHVYR